MPFLELRTLSKTYPGGSVGLLPTDLTVERGERLVLVGPSGSGKSTLLRLLCGLEEPDRGEILLNGERIDRLPPHKRGIGFVPQKPALYPQWDVRRNLQAGTPDTKAGRRRRPAVAESQGDAVAPLRLSEVEELLNLAPLLKKYPHELSGGERQRVALARLLLRNAPLWLLDEPFSHLDSPFRAGFRHELHLMLERSSATMILVTHDPADAWALGKRFGVLEGGRLRDAGTPGELQANPTCSFAAFSLASYQRIDGFVEREVSAAHGRRETRSGTFVSECGAVRIPLPMRVSQATGSEPPPRMTFGIRPEDIIARLPGSPPPSFEAPVELRGWPPLSAEPAGGGWLLTVARGTTRLRTEWRTGPPPPVGKPIDWVIAAERGLWFDGTTGERI
jgi:multiple sugar transport system ATP-binding protein